MTDQLTEEQFLEFSILYGTLFSLSVTLEYCDGIVPVMASRKANYAVNKAKTAEAACKALETILMRELVKKMTPDEKAVALAAIEEQKQILYSFFMLEPDRQRRVKNLISKLNKEIWEVTYLLECA